MTPLTTLERQSDAVKRKHRLPDEPTQAPFTDVEMQMLRKRPVRYAPELEQSVIEDLGKGYSFGGFAGLIGVGRSTINKWRQDHPEFDEACARAAAVRQRWYETKFIEVCETGGTGAQGTVVMFGLMNSGREDWKQKQEIEHTGQITLATLVETSMRAIESRLVDVTPQLEPRPEPAAQSSLEDDLFG